MDEGTDPICSHSTGILGFSSFGYLSSAENTMMGYFIGAAVGAIIGFLVSYFVIYKKKK